MLSDSVCDSLSKPNRNHFKMIWLLLTAFNVQYMTTTLPHISHWHIVIEICIYIRLHIINATLTIPTIAIIIINSGSTKLFTIQPNCSFEMRAWLNAELPNAHVKLQLINGKHIFCHIPNYAIYTSFQPTNPLNLHSLCAMCAMNWSEKGAEQVIKKLGEYTNDLLFFLFVLLLPLNRLIPFRICVAFMQQWPENSINYIIFSIVSHFIT